jgi:hypothetical protein
VNQTANYEGLIGGGCAVGTALLGSTIAGIGADPAAQGLLTVMCGCIYGPLIALFIGLAEIVALRAYLKSKLKEPDDKRRRAIFGISALAGVVTPILVALLVLLI